MIRGKQNEELFRCSTLRIYSSSADPGNLVKMLYVSREMRKRETESQMQTPGKLVDGDLENKVNGKSKKEVRGVEGNTQKVRNTHTHIYIYVYYEYIC